MSAATDSRRRRANISFPTLIDYWSKNYADTFPNLPAAVTGWAEPFCFRCGWLAPTRETEGRHAWTGVGGWLEKAHLHDFSGAGADHASNIVPLCMLCHRRMPDFPDSRDEAAAWVSEQGHRGCPMWWQVRTDSIWMGDSPVGPRTFANEFVKWASYRESALETAAA